MEQNNQVLCAANGYNKKYYFNPMFQALPEGIKKELNILSVLFTEDVGGILSLEFTETGKLVFNVRLEDDDFGFDEIGSELKIKELQQDKKELLETLELFYRVVILQQDLSLNEEE